MEQARYILSIHPMAMEGVELSHSGGESHVEQQLSTFKQPLDPNLPLLAQLRLFLETHEWENAYVSVVIPTDMVTLRTLEFPFQDKKKIEQILAFEIENEVMGELEDMHYTHVIQKQEDGSSKVLLFLLEQDFLTNVKELLAEYNLLIRNIDFSAHSLAYVLPSADGVHYQIFLGIHEVFISILQDHELQTCKVIPIRVGQALQDMLTLHPIDHAKLIEHLHVPDDEDAGGEPFTLSESLVHTLHEIMEHVLEYNTSRVVDDVKWVVSQLNLFFKVHHYEAPASLSIEGPLKTLIRQDGERFEMVSEALPLVQELMEHKEPMWGVLDTLQHHPLIPLENNKLSFYSEGTRWHRFLMRNRKSLVVAGILVFLSLGLVGNNYILHGKLQQQQLTSLQQQIDSTLGQSGINPAQHDSQEVAIAALEKRIEDRKKSVERSKQFTQRNYPNLGLLKRFSELTDQLDTEKKIKILVERMEYKEDRFSVHGVINNYDGLDEFKKRLLEFEEFKGKELVENNRSTPDGIIYRLSISE